MNKYDCELFKNDLKRAIKFVRENEIRIHLQSNGFREKSLQWMADTERNVPAQFRTMVTAMIEGLSPKDDMWAKSEQDNMSALVAILISRLHGNNQNDEADADIEMADRDDEDDDTADARVTVRRICTVMEGFETKSAIWSELKSMPLTQTGVLTEKIQWNAKNDIYSSRKLVFAKIVDRNTGDSKFNLDARSVEVRGGFDPARGIMHKTFMFF